MRLPAGRTLFLVAVAVVTIWIGYLARAVVTPLVAALLLAYVLDPVVRRLERFGMSRSAASGLLVAVAWVGIVAGIGFAATQLVTEVTDFYDQVAGEPLELPKPDQEAARARLAERAAPATIPESAFATGTWDGEEIVFVDADGDRAFRPGLARIAAAKVAEFLSANAWTKVLAEKVKETAEVGPAVAATAGRWLTGAAKGGQAALQTLVGLLTMLILFPIYLYYSLSRLAWVYDVTVSHLPGAHRERIVDLLGKVHLTLSAFFRGRLILLVLRFVVVLGILLAFGVPFAAVLAAVAAVASLVPVIGGIVANVIPALVQFASGTPVGGVVWLLVVLLVYDAVENYVLTPLLVGKEVGLHALTILVCTFVAGDLLGVFGMLLAIPITAVLKILVQEFVLPELRRQAGIPAGAAAPAEVSGGSPT